jgi:hypothetical protein
MLYLILATSAWATPFDSWKCSVQLAKLTKEWKATNEWIKQDLGGLESSFYASPTDKVGQWVLIRKTSKGIGVAKADQNGRLEASFEGSSCTPKTKPYTNKITSQNLFTDKNLAVYIQQKKNGLIYVWSPRMHLSKDGLQEIKKAAEKSKTPLLILLAKDVPEQEYQKLKKTLGSELTLRVDSFDFKMRNVDQHYPALLAFKNGSLISKVKHGYEKTDGYLRDINQLMGK